MLVWRCLKILKLTLEEEAGMFSMKVTVTFAPICPWKIPLTSVPCAPHIQSCELELKEMALEYTRLGPACGGTQERLAVITVTAQKGVLTPAAL